MDLVGDRGALFDGAAAGHFEEPDRFDWPLKIPGTSGGFSVEYRPSSSDSVGDVGLAVTASGLTVGTDHLNNTDAALGKDPG